MSLRAASVIATATACGLLAWFVSSLPTAHGDFAVIWTPALWANPYDHQKLVSALHWPGPVAFAYPPSALPIIGAFGLLPYRAALVLWAALSGAVLALSSRTQWAPLLILTPPALWAIPGGQTSVLLGSMLLGSLLLPNRPVLSGIILGLALSLKPQLVVMLPLALLIERRWLVVTVAAATFAAMVILSAVIFGPQQWANWLQSLPSFLALHHDTGVLRRNEIAFGLPTWLRLCVFGVGTILTVLAIRRDDIPAAFVTALSSSLIASPHAMGYEFAAFLPVIPVVFKRAPAVAALFILTPALIWTFPAILDFMPRLVALVILTASVTPLRERPDFTARPSRLGAG